MTERLKTRSEHDEIFAAEMDRVINNIWEAINAGGAYELAFSEYAKVIAKMTIHNVAFDMIAAARGAVRKPKSYIVYEDQIYREPGTSGWASVGTVKPKEGDIIDWTFNKEGITVTCPFRVVQRVEKTLGDRPEWLIEEVLR